MICSFALTWQDAGVWWSKWMIKINRFTWNDDDDDTHLTASFPAGSRKVNQKAERILMKPDIMGWQWHQLDHMQIICTLLQTDSHANTSSILQAGYSSWCPTNSVKKFNATRCTWNIAQWYAYYDCNTYKKHKHYSHHCLKVKRHGKRKWLKYHFNLSKLVRSCPI